MDIAAIEEFLTTAELPEKIELHKSVVISDVPLFIKSHLTIVKAHGNVPAFRAFVLRLQQVYDIIKNMPANA